MKYVLLLLILTGCVETIPPEVPQKEIVTPPRVYGEILSVEVMVEPSSVIEEVPHTWMTGDEVAAAIESRKSCHCLRGDPMCFCLE